MPEISVNGTRLYYETCGPKQGTPIVLIQGFGSQMTSWPDSLHEGLAAAGHFVIRFDNRDVGLSQKYEGLSYTLNDMADDVAALIDALHVSPAHVAGASMGGMIAQLVAIRQPQKLRSLISIFSTTSDPSLPRTDPVAQAALMTPPPSHSREDVVAHTLGNRRVYASTAWPFDEDFLRQRIGDNFDRCYLPEGHARQWAAIMASPARTAALKKLRVPTLVLHGTADVLINPVAGAHTAATIPGAQLVMIDGWGHDMPQLFVPTLLVHITAFTAEVDRKAA